MIIRCNVFWTGSHGLGGILTLCVSVLGSTFAHAQGLPASSKKLYERAATAIASADPQAAIEPLELLVKAEHSPLSEVAVVHLAECYLQVHQAETAAKLLQEWSERLATNEAALKISPDLVAHHARVWLQAARSTTVDSDAIDSLAALTQHCRQKKVGTPSLSAAQADAAMELAKRYLSANRLPEAERCLAETLADQPSAAGYEAQLISALLLKKLGKTTEAQQKLIQLGAGDIDLPAVATARLEVASEALRAAQLELAESQLEPLQAKFMAGRKNNQRLFDLDFECRFRLLAADVAMALGHPHQALEVLPSDAELELFSPTQRVALRFARAEAAARARQQGVARRDLDWLHDESERANPPPAWATTVELRRCELLLAEKSYEQLRHVAEDAKRRFPQFERLHEFDYLLARAAVLEIDFDTARKCLQSIIEQTNSRQPLACARAHWLIGETYFLQQQFEAALAAYQPATVLTSQHPWHSLALLQSGKCLELLQRPQEALKAYEQVVKLTSDTRLRDEATTRIEVVQRLAQNPQAVQR